MISLVKEIHSPRPLLHKEGDQRSVRLGRVALPAGEDQIVRTVVGSLPTAGPNVVQRDGVSGGLGTAIGAHRTVEVEEPIAVGLHGAAR
jgi:hypothetical protein